METKDSALGGADRTGQTALNESRFPMKAHPSESIDGQIIRKAHLGID